MSVTRPAKPAHRTTHKYRGRSGVHPSPASAPGTASASSFSLLKTAFSGRALWVCLGLIAAIAVVYGPVRHYDFINFDDPLYIVENQHVLNGLTWQGVKWAFTTGQPFYWHPVTWLAFMLDAQLYGMNAGGHHITNVLIHIANTLLLFWLLRRMTGSLGRSAFVAGLFAVHPLHVESVVWAAELKDVLSTLFWMLTLWAYLEYLRRPQLSRYLAMLVLFALGLMTKPMLVTLPFLLLLLDFWPLGRMQLGAEATGSLQSAPRPWLRSAWDRRVEWLPLVREKLPLLALAIASSIVTFVVQRKTGLEPGLEAFPLSGRVANSLVSYVVYIREMMWPVGLAVHYPFTRPLPGWWVAGSVLILAGVSAAAMQEARRRPYLLVGWLWYLGTMAPVIGLVIAGDQPRADHFTYVPLIGLFVMAAWGIPDLLAHWPLRSIALPAAAVLVISLCAITARSQVGYWGNNIALWEHTLKITNENYIAHNNLGNVLFRQGKVSEAIAHYTEALRLNSNYAEAYNNLGVALARQGNVSEAIGQYSQALRFRPDYAEAYNNRGNALSGQSKMSEAIAQYREALRLKPDYAEAHSNLAASLAAEGKNDQALHEFLEAVRIDPNRADFHYNAALMFQRMGQATEANHQFAETNRLRASLARGH